MVVPCGGAVTGSRAHGARMAPRGQQPCAPGGPRRTPRSPIQGALESCTSIRVFISIRRRPSPRQPSSLLRVSQRSSRTTSRVRAPAAPTGRASRIAHGMSVRSAEPEPEPEDRGHVAAEEREALADGNAAGCERVITEIPREHQGGDHALERGRHDRGGREDDLDREQQRDDRQRQGGREQQAFEGPPHVGEEARLGPGGGAQRGLDLADDLLQRRPNSGCDSRNPSSTPTTTESTVTRTSPRSRRPRAPCGPRDPASA